MRIEGNTRWRGLLLALILLMPMSNALALKATSTGAVAEILVDRQAYGQCMLAIEGFSAPGTCGSKWISLDCSGDFQEKNVSRAMLELAQIAKATGNEVTAYINDATKHNGRCVAYRLIMR